MPPTLRQCATTVITAITAMRAASVMFAMRAMLSRLVAQLKMPRLDAYGGRHASATHERCDANRLGPTFELTGRLRQGGLVRLAKMYRVPPTGPWWPAVGAPLERGVRHQMTTR